RPSRLSEPRAVVPFSLMNRSRGPNGVGTVWMEHGCVGSPRKYQVPSTGDGGMAGWGGNGGMRGNWAAAVPAVPSRRSAARMRRRNMVHLPCGELGEHEPT